MTVTHRTQSITSTQRDAWVEINLSALERNFKKLKELLKTNIMAVVKADAYGHGATAIAPVLQSLKVYSFGVATVDEGIALRKAGIKVPILILGATPFWSFESCYTNELSITIYSVDQLKQIEDFNKTVENEISVQVKIDTGMNRLGISPAEASSVIERIRNSKKLKLDGIFSHLSDASNYDFSKVQKERFDQVIKDLNDIHVQKHIANSYATINYPEFRYDLVRIGIALYGQEFNFLEPLISLKGRITEIHKVLKDESVSYSRTWRAKKDSLIATVPIGYADGVDRNLSNRIHALYNEVKINQVGNITMDQMMFDISEIKDAKVGDVITLIDKKLLISDWAEKLNTITYELICRLRMRLPRVYTRD
ncbi:MAG: alanine racemase [Candidatus Melainabacteria bacterium]|nr:alanine racemase [Candidatus Melainabacteria bacterium]